MKLSGLLVAVGTMVSATIQAEQISLVTLPEMGNVIDIRMLTSTEYVALNTAGDIMKGDHNGTEVTLLGGRASVGATSICLAGNPGNGFGNHVLYTASNQLIHLAYGTVSFSSYFREVPGTVDCNQMITVNGYVVTGSNGQTGYWDLADGAIMFDGEVSPSNESEMVSTSSEGTFNNLTLQYPASMGEIVDAHPLTNFEFVALNSDGVLFKGGHDQTAPTEFAPVRSQVSEILLAGNPRFELGNHVIYVSNGITYHLAFGTSLFLSYEIQPGLVPTGQMLTEIGYIAEDSDGMRNIIDLATTAQTPIASDATNIVDMGDGVFAVISESSPTQYFELDQGQIFETDPPVSVVDDAPVSVVTGGGGSASFAFLLPLFGFLAIGRLRRTC